MVTVLPEEAATLKPTDVDQLRFAVRAQGDSGFVFMHNFQDHVATHDLTDLQIAVHTRAEEIRIPKESKFTLKSETAVILPFNMTCDGVRLKYATAQPLARLTCDGGPRYAFVAPEGIDPEFAFDPNTASHIESKDCSITTSGAVSLVRCAADKVAEFTVQTSAGEQITFVVFPKAMALRPGESTQPKASDLSFPTPPC